MGYATNVFFYIVNASNKTYYLSISEDKKVFEVLLVFVLDLHDSGIKIIITLII